LAVVQERLRHGKEVHMRLTGLLLLLLLVLSGAVALVCRWVTVNSLPAFGRTGEVHFPVTEKDDRWEPFAFDGRRVAVADQVPRIAVFDIVTGNRIMELRLPADAAIGRREYAELEHPGQIALYHNFLWPEKGLVTRHSIPSCAGFSTKISYTTGRWWGLQTLGSPFLLVDRDTGQTLSLDKWYGGQSGLAVSDKVAVQYRLTGEFRQWPFRRFDSGVTGSDYSQTKVTILENWRGEWLPLDPAAYGLCSERLRVVPYHDLVIIGCGGEKPKTVVLRPNWDHGFEKVLDRTEYLLGLAASESDCFLELTARQLTRDENYGSSDVLTEGKLVSLKDGREYPFFWRRISRAVTYPSALLDGQVVYFGDSFKGLACCPSAKGGSLEILAAPRGFFGEGPARDYRWLGNALVSTDCIPYQDLKNSFRIETLRFLIFDKCAVVPLFDYSTPFDLGGIW